MEKKRKNKWLPVVSASSVALTTYFGVFVMVSTRTEITVSNSLFIAVLSVIGATFFWIAIGITKDNLTPKSK